MTRTERLLRTLPGVQIVAPKEASRDTPPSDCSLCLTTSVSGPFAPYEEDPWTWEVTLLEVAIDEDDGDFMPAATALLRATFTAHTEENGEILYGLKQASCLDYRAPLLAQYVSHPNGEGLNALAWAAEEASQLVRGWKLPPELDLWKHVQGDAYDRAASYLDDGASIIGAATAAKAVENEYRKDHSLSEREAVRRAILAIASMMDVGSTPCIEGMRTLLTYADCREG